MNTVRPVRRGVPWGVATDRSDLEDDFAVVVDRVRSEVILAG